MDSNLSLLEGWKWVRLEDVCEINPRDKLNGFADDTDVTFVPMASVDEIKGEISKPLTKKLSQVRKGYTNFKDGDVIFAKITPCMENGKCAIAKNLVNSVGFGSTEFHVLRPSDKILSEYLYLYLRQPFFRNEAQYSMTGTAGQLRVPTSFIKDAKIPLPPIEQQKFIVKTVIAALTRAEAAKRFLLDSEKSIDKIVPAAISKAIPTKDPLPEGWKWNKIGDLCKVVSGGTPSRSKPKYWNGQIPWVKISDMRSFFVKDTEEKITESGLDNSSAKLLPKGTVLFTVFATLGEIAVLNIEAATNQAIAGLFIKNKETLNKEFLIFYLKSIKRGWLAKSKGVTQNNINLTILKNTDIPVPPLNEQKQIVYHVNSIMRRAEKLKELNDIALERVEKINSSILSKAFRGGLVIYNGKR